jgi:hypothetical protein
VYIDCGDFVPKLGEVSGCRGDVSNRARGDVQPSMFTRNVCRLAAHTSCCGHRRSKCLGWRIKYSLCVECVLTRSSIILCSFIVLACDGVLDPHTYILLAGLQSIDYLHCWCGDSAHTVQGLRLCLGVPECLAGGPHLGGFYIVSCSLVVFSN